MIVFDAQKFYDYYGIEYWTEGKNVQDGWINIQCPFCGDKSNHLGYDITGGYYNCWRCGGKSVNRVLRVLLSVTYTEAVKVETKYSMRGRLVRKLNKKEVNKDIVEKDIPDFEVTKRMCKYLKNERGLNPDFIINKYDIRGGGVAGDYKYRLIIPWYYKNKIVAFQARSLINTGIRYLSSNKVIKNYLYNIDNCKKEVIIVLEGVVDVWKMGNNTCATAGTSITEYQIEKLSKYKKIIFLFDSEKEAQQKAEKAGYKLASLGCEVEIVDMETEDDVGDMSISQAKRLKRSLLYEKS